MIRAAHRLLRSAAGAALLWLVPASATAQPVHASLTFDQGPSEEDVLLAERMGAMLRSLRQEAQATGIAPSAFDRAVAGLTPDGSILELLTRQPEHALAPWDYIGRIVSEKRVAEGRQMVALHTDTLSRIEARFGVDAHVVAAIWGIESSYGALPGARSVIRSLATLTVADARRPAFWRKELLTAVHIAAEAGIDPATMVGSWAGAMGHTQFMPTSYRLHAVDFDGDGRRDIWGSVPDALASTANFLSRSGWQRGQRWGTEVALPAGFDLRLTISQAARRLAEWEALGVKPPQGREWPPGLGSARLLLPSGADGPAFLVTAGFEAVLKYNNATLYALSVGLLADRLADRASLVATWPLDDPPLDRNERIELQERLARQGFDTGPVDGVVGESTRAAIRTWQSRYGLAPDGWAGRRLLGLLRLVGPVAR